MLVIARRFTHVPSLVPSLASAIRTWLNNWKWLLIPVVALIGIYTPIDAHGQSPSSPSAVTSFVF